MLACARVIIEREREEKRKEKECKKEKKCKGALFYEKGVYITDTEEEGARGILQL